MVTRGGGGGEDGRAGERRTRPGEDAGVMSRGASLGRGAGLAGGGRRPAGAEGAGPELLGGPGSGPIRRERQRQRGRETERQRVRETERQRDRERQRQRQREVCSRPRGSRRGPRYRQRDRPVTVTSDCPASATFDLSTTVTTSMRASASAAQAIFQSPVTCQCARSTPRHAQHAAGGCVAAGSDHLGEHWYHTRLRLQAQCAPRACRYWPEGPRYPAPGRRRAGDQTGTTRQRPRSARGP